MQRKAMFGYRQGGEPTLWKLLGLFSCLLVAFPRVLLHLDSAADSVSYEHQALPCLVRVNTQQDVHRIAVK